MFIAKEFVRSAISGFIYNLKRYPQVEGKTFYATSFAAVPSFNLLYKKNDYSLFANASVIGGGATLEYEGGAKVYT